MTTSHLKMVAETTVETSCVL